MSVEFSIKLAEDCQYYLLTGAEVIEKLQVSFSRKKFCVEFLLGSTQNQCHYFTTFSIKTVVAYTSSNMVRATSACTQHIPCLTDPHIQNRPIFSHSAKHPRFSTVLAVHYLCTPDMQHHFFSVRGEVICSSDRMH